MNPIVREHPVYKGYFVSASGQVFSTKRGTLKPLKYFEEKNGYRSIYFYHEGKAIFQRIHQVVADTFLPKTEGGEDEYNIIHHKDCKKTNNHYTNLQRCKNRAEHIKLHWQLDTYKKAVLV